MTKVIKGIVTRRQVIMRESRVSLVILVRIVFITKKGATNVVIVAAWSKGLTRIHDAYNIAGALGISERGSALGVAFRPTNTVSWRCLIAWDSPYL